MTPLPLDTPLPDQAQRLRAMVGEIVEHKPAPTAGADTAVPRGARTGTPVIAIASGKGGVGKTTIAVNIAAELSAQGLRVSLIDGDLGLGNADVLCGLNPSRNLAHVIAGQCPFEDAVIEAPGGFRLVAGASGVPALAQLDAPGRRALLLGLESMESTSDAVLIDCGAGIGSNVLSLVAASDLALVVTTPEPTAITDAYALLKCAHGSVSDARGESPPSLALVVNQCTSAAEALAVHRRIGAVCERFLGVTVPFAGSVRHDDAAGRAVRARRPLVQLNSGSTAARDIRALSGFVSAVTSIDPRRIPCSGAERVPTSWDEQGGWVARLLRVVTR